MPKSLVRLGSPIPLFDMQSFGREFSPSRSTRAVPSTAALG
jgi:hypothetical protein